ncbi:MAG: prolyl oligopeptidase family serine peptidase [Bacteroidales bacterium]
MMKIVTALLSTLLFSTSIYCQEGFKAKEYISSKGDTILYRELPPPSNSKKKSYPLVLFLHGAGERGTDNVKQMTHGANMFTNPVNRDKYPAYVLMPQCPESGYWAFNGRPKSLMPNDMPIGDDITPIFASLKEMIDIYISLPEIDSKRIYIVGLSMGAMGTYDIVSRFPKTFAAAVPICGTVNPDKLKNIENVSFRIFHGDADNIVPVEGSREAYKALKKAGTKVEYIEYPGCNHGSWNPAFNEKDFLEWIFKQKR